jgi:competence protein ComEA
MKNKKYYVILACSLVIILIIIKIKSLNNNEVTVSENIVSEEENVEIEENDTIKIHISGEINSPGLIELEIGSRIFDAIEKAGGITESADVSKVNLAYILSDGEKIYIPSFDDEWEDINLENVNSETNLKTNINNANEEQLEKLPGIGESIAKAIIEYRKTNGRFLDINDLKNVSGIGESKFNRLKDYICVK